MSENHTIATPAAPRGTLTPRTISRKLLARKATAKAGGGAEPGDALEDAFPSAPSQDAAIADDPVAGDARPGDDAAAGDVVASEPRDPTHAGDPTLAYGAPNIARPSSPPAPPLPPPRRPRPNRRP